MRSAFSKYSTEKTKRQQTSSGGNGSESKNEGEIKKPKYENYSPALNNSTSASNENSDLTSTSMQLEEEQMTEVVYDEPNDVEMKFIGYDTFNEAVMFSDLSELGSSDPTLNNDDNDLILLSLDLNEIFCFKGKAVVKVLHGSIEINGYHIDAETHKSKNYDLFSPDTHSNLCIINKTSVSMLNISQKQLIFNDILTQLSQINRNLNAKNEQLVEFLQKNLENDENSMAIVMFKKLKSKLCNYFNKFDNYKQMYQTSQMINYITSPNDIKFAYLNLYPVHANNLIFYLNRTELNVINEIVEASKLNRQKAEVILACGGKDVGKSTYLRYLVNSLLNSHEKVAYLDCDPGQCEFTLSGTLQLTVITEPLLGPPHTHLAHSPDSCYFFGHLSPNDIPGQYLEGVRKCYAHYLKLNTDAVSKIPLIVNTMGWNQGLGLCFLKEQISITKPTYILQLESSDANKNLPAIDYNWFNSSMGWPPRQDATLYSAPNYKLITIVRKPFLIFDQQNEQQQNRRKLVSYSAKDHRTIAILAYFSALQESKQSYFRPIHHLKPYRVTWSNFGVHVAHMKVAYQETLRALNASLVALCKIDEKFIKRPEVDKQLPGYLDFSAVSQQENTNLQSYKCLGFGVIRGINMDTKEFYILTPEPMDRLNQVNLLVKGMLNVPVEFFYEQDSDTPSPYVAFVDNRNSNNNVIANEPIQRKYLIHQNTNSYNAESK